MLLRELCRNSSFVSSWSRLILIQTRRLTLSATCFEPSDCYSLLGVKFNAEQKEIKEQFYKLSKEYHPDLNKEESSLKKFKEIAEAYEILSNPETRKEYDKKMGFRIRNPGNSGAGGPREPGHYTYTDDTGSHVRYPGMKGEFRNGRYVDDNPQEYRHIHYDLDPEKMEKIWKRYKKRWDRVDEIEKERVMLEKKLRFRKLMDEKRERMFKNLMSNEEREEFMFRIRLHRPDAVEDFDINDVKNGSKPSEEKGHHNPFNQHQESPKKNQAKDEEFERSTRDILKKHFGVSDEELDRLDIGAEMNHKKPKSEKEEIPRDEFFEGLKTSDDATSWRDFLLKAKNRSTERWNKLRNDRIESPQTSKKYNIGPPQAEDNFGAKLVVVLLLAAAIMGYSEKNNNIDK